MTPRVWRVLVVDDEPHIAENTAAVLRGLEVAPNETVDASHSTSFSDAVTLLTKEPYDLLVLDVRDQSRGDGAVAETGETGTDDTDADVGLSVLKEIRRARFVPVIFFTALPQLVRGSDVPAPPFVSVVSKLDDDSTEALRTAVIAVFGSQLPTIHRALLDHVEEVVRDFMALFVEKHWETLSSPPRKGDVAHLLLRRLALSLTQGAQVLAGRLDYDDIELHDDAVHPMRLYVIPPVDACVTGDLLYGPRPTTTGGEKTPETEGWFVVLTPACDLVSGRVKADFVMVAECVLLSDEDMYREFTTALESPEELSRTKALRTLMRSGGGQEDRRFYLPAAWDVPDLLIDFQRVTSIPHSDLNSYRRVATLDSPYAESVVQRFVRYIGRIGTPDLDLDVAIERIRRFTPK